MRGPDPYLIERAADRIDPSFLNTPAYELSSVSHELGVEIIFKDERTGPIGSFKGRGAELLVSGYPEGLHFVCASAGNFGQGMAWAAERRGSTLTVFASTNATRCKIDAMARLGASIQLHGSDFDEAKVRARAFAESYNFVFIEDGAHPEIAEGAGTLALELTQSTPPFDAWFVPLGNGALAAGTGAWLRHSSPSTRIIAVCAERAPAMGLAVEGLPIDDAPCDTVADGIAVRVPVPAAVAAVRKVVDDVVFVPEARIGRAMNIIEHATGRRVEAAGAVGLAGLMQQLPQWQGKRVAIPICGGNRDE